MKLSHAQIHDVGQLIRQVAADIVMPPFTSLAAIQSEIKTSPDDIVTQADKAVEAALTRVLLQIAPDSTVIGEETTGADFALVREMMKSQGVVWIIDPIDGTYNYARKNPEFGVMVACAIGGVTRHAWIYYPAKNNLMLTATQGEGTFLESDGKISKVRPMHMPLRDMRVAWFAIDKDRRADHAAMANIEQALSGHTAGTFDHYCVAAETLAMLRDGNKALVYINSSPWDVVPVALALREAGGAAIPLDAPDADLFGYTGMAPVLFTPTRATAEELRRLPHFQKLMV